MTDQSIFDDTSESSQSDPTSSTSTSEQTNAADQLLGSIVNADGKPKYSTVEDALKGAAAAQEHIRRLEAENTQFKQEVGKSTTLQDVLDAVKQSPGEETNTAPTPLDEDALAAIVEGLLDKRSTAQRQKDNATQVASAFQNKYGAEAETKYLEAAGNVGFSKAEINQLSASNPSAVLKLLGLADTGKAEPASLSSSANTSHFTKQEEPPARFDPFKAKRDESMEAWRKSVEATNKRLGLN